MPTTTKKEPTEAKTPIPRRRKPAIAKSTFEGHGMSPQLSSKLMACMGIMLVDRPPKFWKETMLQILECWAASDFMEGTPAKDRRVIMANLSLLAITFTNDF